MKVKLDEQMMSRCLELAKIAAKNGDAAVGSIIVRNGEIIAEGIESVKLEKDPTAHAEIKAVRFACKKLHTLDLSDCVLYTNVEPCWMCSYAIRQTRISRVVFGSRNKSIGGFSSRFQILMDENLMMPLPKLIGWIGDCRFRFFVHAGSSCANIARCCDSLPAQNKYASRNSHPAFSATLSSLIRSRFFQQLSGSPSGCCFSVSVYFSLRSSVRLRWAARLLSTLWTMFEKAVFGAIEGSILLPSYHGSEDTRNALVAR